MGEPKPKLQREPQLFDDKANEHMLELEYRLKNGELERDLSPEKFQRVKQKVEAWGKVFHAESNLGKTAGRIPPVEPPVPGKGMLSVPEPQGVPFQRPVVTDIKPTEAEAAKPVSAWEAHKQKLKAGRTAGQLVQEYKTDPADVRPSAYIPGLGGAPLEDGEWWQKNLASLPAGVRDKILGREVGLASRSSVWVEPTDEEAAAAVRAEREAQGLRPKDAGVYIKRWKDRKWAEAYDAAQKAGKPIYRARDVSTASPEFIKRAAADVTRVWQPAEAFLRQADRGMTMGAVGAAVDTGLEGAKHLGRAPFEYFGVPPPSFLAPDADAQAEVQRNLERGSRAVEASPVAAGAGAVAGMVAPGLGNVIGKGATKGFGKLAGGTAGRGVISGMAMHGAASGLTAGIEQLGASRLQSEAGESAGLPEIPWSQSYEDAGFAASLAIAPGMVMGVPSGMSRGMRETDSPQKSALTHLGPDSTTLTTWSGLKTPEGHESLSKDNPKIGAYGAARSDAVDRMADVFEAKGREHDAAQAARARENEADLVYSIEGAADHMMGKDAELNRQVGGMSEEVVGRIEAEGQDFLSNLQSLSADIVDSSANTARQTEEEALRFTDRFMKRAQAQRDDMRGYHQEETEAAYALHGAPPREPIPGPDMPMGAIEEARRVAADQPPYGLQPNYPTVDTTPIVDEISNVLADMSFQDGTHFPTSSHKKLKDTLDSLLVKRTMTPKEAEAYKDVFFDVKEERGMVTFSTRRNIHVREADKLIQSLDEAAKYPDTASPDAARYRQIAGVARKTRDAGFPLLGQTKAEHHLALNETERMLRSVGLQKNIDEINPQDIDQVRTIHENIKALARGEEINVPEGLAVPRKEFEKWLSAYDPDLFDQYAILKRLSRQQQEADAFDISMNAVPMGRAKSLQLVEAALLGKDHDAAAVLETFKSYGDRVEALRQQNKRVGGLFEALGADKNMKSLSDFQRKQYKVGANQFFLEGGPRFEYIREQMPPEVREKMDYVREAAVDIDSMFRAAGFGPKRENITRSDVTGRLRANQPAPTKRAPSWGDKNLDQLMDRQDSTTRGDVVSHLHSIIKGYERYKGERQFDDLVNETFKAHPEVMQALKRMSEERAFAWMKRYLKGDEAVDIFGARQAWYAAATDFIQNHVDALVAHEGGKKNLWWGDRNPLDVPAPYAAGMVAPSEDDPNREAEFGTMSGVKAMEALFRAVELMQAKENQP